MTGTAGASKTYGLYVNASGSDDANYAAIFASGNVGIGTTAPAALLSAGATSQFQVDSAGDLIKVKNIAYSWPSSQGGASTVLTNNGSGSLTWGAASSSSVTSVTGTAPVSVATGTTTPVISISQANGTTNGYLGSVDWTTFNNKQAAGNYITALTGDGTLSGFSAGSATLTLKNTGTAGTYVKVTTDAQGRVSSGVSTIANADIAAAAGIDATKIGGGGVTTAEFNFLGSVTSDVQTQLNALAPLASPTFTGVLAIPLGAAATPSLTFTGDANTGLWSPAADTIAFSTNGTERVRILSSGNVGIGSVSPTSKLDIPISGSNSILTAGYVSLEYFPTAANKYIGGAVGLNFKNKGDGVNWVQKTDTLHNAGGLIASTIETGSMNFYTFPNSGTPTADANLADANLSTYQRMTITAAGYVGVGTSAPQSSMEIYKSAAGALGPVLTLNNPGGAGGSAAIDFQNYSGNTQPVVSRMSIVDDGLYSANLAFSTKITGASGNALAERMRITSSGNVGIGTTSPGVPLDVQTSTSIAIPAYGYLNLATPTGVYTGMTAPVSVRGSGRMVAAEFNAVSDRREKENIVDITEQQALGFITKVAPVHFSWKSGAKSQNYGFIAQDLLKDGYDELVSMVPKPGMEQTIDADGFVSPSDYQFNVNYSEVGPILTKVAQIHEAEIEQLKIQQRDKDREISDLRKRAEMAEAQLTAFKNLLCAKFPNAQLCQ